MRLGDSYGKHETLVSHASSEDGRIDDGGGGEEVMELTSSNAFSASSIAPARRWASPRSYGACQIGRGIMVGCGRLRREVWFGEMVVVRGRKKSSELSSLSTS